EYAGDHVCPRQGAAPRQRRQRLDHGHERAHPRLSTNRRCDGWTVLVESGRAARRQGHDQRRQRRRQRAARGGQHRRDLGSDDPPSIKTLAIMPFGAVTPSFDMSARRFELPFTVQADGSLKVDLPASSNLLTPGYWMLFAINDNGTPSIASSVKVGTELLYDLPAQLPLDL